jgi:tetratricopeptide (TPR) repeat protein
MSKSIELDVSDSCYLELKNMNSRFILTSASFSTIAIIVLQPQIAMALSANEIARIAKQVTVQVKSINNGSGSGVIIEHEGKTYTVLTAAHVVQGKDQYTVFTFDGQRHEVPFAAMKPLPGLDLALAQFTSNRSYEVAKMGDSTTLRAGSLAYISGFPKRSIESSDTTYRFSPGEIAANATHPLQDGYALAYFNDTFVGMSGGAVWDEKGTLIGIHGRSQTAYRENLGVNPLSGIKFSLNLAIPIQYFKQKSSGQFLQQQNLSPDDFLIQGVEKEAQGNRQGAISDYNEAIRLNPRLFATFFSRGNVRSALGDKQGATADFDKSIQLNPNFIFAYNNRGLARVELGDKTGAIADYDKVIQLNPSYSIAYNNRGGARSQLGDERGAIKDFDKAIQLNSSFAGAYHNRGLSRSRLGDKQGSIVDYNKAIQFQPSYREAYYNRGIARLALGDMQGALKDFDKSIQLKPSDPKAYNNRGIARIALGDKQGSLKDFDKAIQLKPSDESAYCNRGGARILLGDMQGALKDFDKAIQLKPSYTLAYSNRGLVRSKLGDKQGAIADLQKAISLAEKEGDIAGSKQAISRLSKIQGSPVLREK